MEPSLGEGHASRTPLSLPTSLALWLRKPRLESDTRKPRVTLQAPFTPRAGSPPPQHRGRVPPRVQSFPSSHVPGWRERRENTGHRGQGPRTANSETGRRRLEVAHAQWPCRMAAPAAQSAQARAQAPRPRTPRPRGPRPLAEGQRPRGDER